MKKTNKLFALILGGLLATGGITGLVPAILISLMQIA